MYFNLLGLNKRRKRGNMCMAVKGAQQVYEASKKFVQNSVDLKTWEIKISEELTSNKNITTESEKFEATNNEENEIFEYQEEKYELYRHGILTIGCVGFPNVGKSSLLNSLVGKKVVSVSRTPGHTKHFQTIFLTENIRLCDCPGLVFPSSIPRSLQILIGSYPIAQVRVPMASVKYLAENIDLVKRLNINHAMVQNCDTKKDDWTAFQICEAWAIKRGFLTTKAARPDSSRAANNILRMALDGQIVMYFVPFNFNRDEGKFSFIVIFCHQFARSNKKKTLG